MKFNIDKIKQISIVDYLQSKGIAPIKQEGKKILYKIRDERTASCYVYTDTNMFKDFGSGAKGTVIDLSMYINSFSSYDAMKELSEFMNGGYSQNSVSLISSVLKEETSKPAMTIVKVQDLQNKALLSYLESRNINVSIAKIYCKEVYIRMNKSGNTLFYVGFESNDKGFALSNGLSECRKICTSQDITTLKGSEGKEVNIFEGFIDFLSYLTKYNRIALKNDFIILNSVGNIFKAIGKVNRYAKINCFLDNDIASAKTLDTLKNQFGDKIKDYSYLYKNYKDFNDFICNKPIHQKNFDKMKEKYPELRKLVDLLGLEVIYE